MSSMTAEEQTLLAAQREISELKLRLEELGAENQDLRTICTRNGIQYEESLAVQRHRRNFARAIGEHPI